MKKLTYLLILLSQLWVATWALQSSSFIVKNIEVQGLQHISKETVENYLPIRRGQTLRPETTANILRALYKAGFFDRINLSRKGNTLIIHVTERPTIGQLKISGNSVIQTDKLTGVMKNLDVAEGHPYNPVVLEKIKQSLLNQYYQLGRYNARVTIDSMPMSRNRVSVKITISEGLVAKVRRISIIGNHTFSEKTLIKEMDVTTPGLFTFVSQTDRYSEEKLETSLEKIRSYYMDHGYLRVEVKSSQAEVTPDRKSVYITIVIDEGAPYVIKSYDIQGEALLFKDELLHRITFAPGETFSRQKVIDSEKAMSTYLGDQGYMFALVSLRPQVDDRTHEIVLIFDVKPGKRTYVRYVNFSSNTRTNDNVLRREVTQMESAPVSTSHLEDSKRRLKMLPFLKDVDMSINPVPEIDDQIDINYKVKEDNAAQASFKIGYSQIYKLILGAGLSQKNFLGTGNTLGINIQHSKFEQTYNMDYTDPYYTEDGISRTFDFAISRVDPGSANGVNGDYTTNEYDLGVLYSIPVGQEVGVFNRILAGVTYQQTLIKLVHDKHQPMSISRQVRSFVHDHGRHFNELDLKVGFSRNSLDRAFFPTTGSFHTLFFDAFLPLDSQSLGYYMLNYSAKLYQPLYKQFIFLAKADLGYGNGFDGPRGYPFFRNYYAGGISSVRGFLGYTLGPLDSTGKAYGGNILVDGSLALIFPNFVSDSVRTSVFVDAGNVYSSLNNKKFGGLSTNSGPIRFSVGLEVDLLTPFGPIELSLAHPFRRPHDKKEVFQFALGANF